VGWSRGGGGARQRSGRGNTVEDSGGETEFKVVGLSELVVDITVVREVRPVKKKGGRRAIEPTTPRDTNRGPSCNRVTIFYFSSNSFARHANININS
jgi:hypothetical protein